MTILEQAISRVLEEADRARAGVACGLLIGSLRDGRYFVERALPCPNVAAGQPGGRVAIDPMALRNVRRSLAGSGKDVLGFFHAPRVDDPELDAWGPDQVERHPGALWLVMPSIAAVPTVRWSATGQAAPREIPFEVVAPAPPTMLAACPE